MMCLVGERSDLLLCPVSVLVSALAGLNLNLIQKIDFLMRLNVKYLYIKLLQRSIPAAPQWPLKL